MSKVKISWDRQHVWKSWTSLARKTWAKMTGEKPSLVKARVKEMLQLTEIPAQGKPGLATATSSLRRAQVCFIQISSDMESGQPCWPGIYLTIPSSVGKSRVLQPTYNAKLKWDTGEAWKKEKAQRASDPSCQRLSAAANVRLVNVQPPWEKISSDACFWFLRFLHNFQDHRTLSYPPKCCIFITNHSNCMLCRPDSAIKSSTNLTDFLRTNPFLWECTYIFPSFWCEQKC